MQGDHGGRRRLYGRIDALFANAGLGEFASLGQITEAHFDKIFAADLARYVVTFTHGPAVRAASGASRAELLRIAKSALQNWPE